MNQILIFMKKRIGHKKTGSKTAAAEFPNIGAPSILKGHPAGVIANPAREATLKRMINLVSKTRRKEKGK
jgi:hypothetical protein